VKNIFTNKIIIHSK